MNPDSEVFWENLVTYSLLLLIIAGVFIYYLRSKKRSSRSTEEKIKKAKEAGFYEPVSLHPVVNHDICIGSGACVAACPENDILGLVDGKAQTINASRCIGHGACFHACPVQAISLVIGTEKRGVELPHVSQEYESNVKGIYIAGELGGMGLIKNAVEQGKQAVENISRRIKSLSAQADYDILIVGAGPAGIAATLKAADNKLKYKTVEQDSLGGTVFTFPRKKVVMTSPMELPLFGKVKLRETSKTELLSLWQKVLGDNDIKINENIKVVSVSKDKDIFRIETTEGTFTSKTILLAVGRRGTPRKLGVPGENLEKVSYRLLEPEQISGEKIVVVGGGDSAIESAFLLADENNDVILSYRKDKFSRLKPDNLERLQKYISDHKIKVVLNSNLLEILPDKVVLKAGDEITELDNDLVYIFVGGELPNKFLEKMGITITKKYGEAVLKHR